MFSKNLILAFILNALFVAAVQASTWTWKENCKPAIKTKCEVWFNSLSVVDKITINKGDKKLDSKFKTYTQLESDSANAILIHVSDLDKNASTNMKKGLIQSIEKTKAFQKFGIYYSGSTFKPLATLGATSADLKSAIQDLKIEAKAIYAIRHLELLISIVGGAQSDKKVIYWVTEGVTLTDAKRKQLNKALKADQIRLVITHLHKNEISQNSGDNLAKLAKQSNGLYQQATLKQWLNKLSQLGHYSVNGGHLSIKTKDLCGSVKLAFVANTSGNNAIKTSWQGVYPACAISSETPVSTDSTATEQSENSIESGSDSPTNEVETEMETDSETQTGESQTETTESETTEQASTKWIVVGAGVGLFILIILVIIIMRKGKKSKPVADQQKRAYGILIDTSGSEEKTYPLKNDAVKIGRSQECDVILINDSVSAIHAELKRQRDGTVTVIDLKSSNGTKVNDVDVVHNTILKAGDIITFGEARLAFRLS